MELQSSSTASSDSSQQSRPENDDAAIKYWTKEEKHHLLDALKQYGPQDLEKIQKYVITKTLEETKVAVDYFTAMGLQDPIFKDTEDKATDNGKQNDPKPKPKRKPDPPLAQWEKLLKDNFQFNELTTEVPTALRMIADLEKIPPPELTEGIDFRLFYHQLANAMEGKPMTVDPGTLAVLQKCVIETGLASKAFIKTAAKRNVLNNINLSDKEMDMYPEPTDNQELAIVRHFASQRSYNPLKIPEDLLKPSASPDEGPSTTPDEGPSTTSDGGPSTSSDGGPSTSSDGGPSTSSDGGPSTSSDKPFP